jgi:endonuclease YncB( thermonuclease family)
MKVPFNYNIVNLVSVTDGDTCVVNVDLGFSVYYKANVRINGVDTPEKNTKEGKIVKKKVESWFKINTDIHLASTELDKYGRVLGDVINSKNESLSSYLLSNGFARVYKGEKKVDWTQDQINKILAQENI